MWIIMYELMLYNRNFKPYGNVFYLVTPVSHSFFKEKKVIFVPTVKIGTFGDTKQVHTYSSIVLVANLVLYTR